MYFVYLLQCSDGSYYCGIAKDVARRCKQHARGTGAKYVRSRCPFTVVATAGSYPIGEALRHERAIKKLPKNQKIAAVLALPA